MRGEEFRESFSLSDFFSYFFVYRRNVSDSLLECVKVYGEFSFRPES